MNKTKTLLLIPLILIAGIVFLFFRMGQHDAQALDDFSAAYEGYDRAFSDLSQSILASPPVTPPATQDLESKAQAALAGLKQASAERISSLTRNDGSLMQAMPVIADLSAQEMAVLKAYENALAEGKPEADQFSEAVGKITKARHEAYSQFLDLEK